MPAATALAELLGLRRSCERIADALVRWSASSLRQNASRCRSSSASPDFGPKSVIRRSRSGLPDDYIPTGSPAGDRHASLKKLRDKVYAHTDKASGRTAKIEVGDTAGEIVTLHFREQWLPFPREVLPKVIEHTNHLRDLFRTNAAVIEFKLRRDAS
jgi:hypothetical protein